MRKIMQSSLYRAAVTSLFLATAAVAQTAAEGSIQLRRGRLSDSHEREPGRGPPDA